MSTRFVHIETDKGRITAELFERDCPGTVENFEQLVRDGFYDGTAVHGVEPDGLLAAGDPLSKDLPVDDPRVGTGGPDWTIACEWVGNKNRHEQGALTMLTDGPDTGGSRFGIVLADDGLPERDGVHTVFGEVIEGIDVARALTVGDRLVSLVIEE